MNKATAKNCLERMKNRYWRSVIARQAGMLVHFGDCDVYRSFEVYGTSPCTCGFNYDLGTADTYMDGFLAKKINPDYNKQMAQQDGLPGNPMSPEQVKEIEEAFIKAGININPDMSAEEKQEGDREAWRLIGEVFGIGYMDYLLEQKKARNIVELDDC